MKPMMHVYSTCSISEYIKTNRYIKNPHLFLTARENDFRPYEVIPNGCGSHRIAEQQTFLCNVRESVLALNKSRGCVDRINRALTDT